MTASNTYTPTPQQPIHSGFGSKTVARDVVKGYNLVGQFAIVTGGHAAKL